MYLPVDSWAQPPQTDFEMFSGESRNMYFLVKSSICEILETSFLNFVLKQYIDIYRNIYPKWIFSEFSQTEHIHVTSTLIKYQNITSNSEALPFMLSSSSYCLSITSILIFNVIEYFCQFYSLYKWNHVVFNFCLNFFFTWHYAWGKTYILLDVVMDCSFSLLYISHCVNIP